MDVMPLLYSLSTSLTSFTIQTQHVLKISVLYIRSTKEQGLRMASMCVRVNVSRHVLKCSLNGKIAKCTPVEITVTISHVQIVIVLVKNRLRTF